MSLPAPERRSSSDRLETIARGLEADGRTYEAQLCLSEARLRGGRELDTEIERLQAINSGLLSDPGDKVASDQKFLAGYQKFYEEMRESPFRDYPRQIHLESAAVCNAACNFCPYPSMERKGHRMPDELIYKILDELREIPKHIQFEICPFKVNEPFLDVRIWKILEYIDQNLPNAVVIITTNAAPLTGSNLQKLKNVKSIHYLHVSFADHRKEEYEQTMQIPYDRTVERLDDIHAAKASGEIAFPIYMTKVGDGSSEDDAYLDWVRARYPLFSPQVYWRQNWLGQVDTDHHKLGQHVGCHRWYELSITSTGVVSHCCMDGEGKWPIGDVSKTNVLEVYRTSPLRALREEAFVRTLTVPCSSCALTAR